MLHPGRLFTGPAAIPRRNGNRSSTNHGKVAPSEWPFGLCERVFYDWDEFRQRLIVEISGAQEMLAFVSSCHVNSQLGAVIVWLLAGAGPMMSISKALAWQIAVMLALITSVVMARAFAETPWLMLPFVFAWISFSTYVGTTRKLGVGLVVIQIVCLITFYGVVFAPQEIGWNAAASFDGSAIALGVIVLFDNWLWPDPGEPILMESLGAGVTRTRSQLLGASDFFLAGESVPRPSQAVAERRAAACGWGSAWLGVGGGSGARNRESPTARLIKLLGRFAGFEDFISQLDEGGARGPHNHWVELRIEFVEDFGS